MRAALARLMGLPRDLEGEALERRVLDHSLVRKIEPWLFDVDRRYRQEKIEARPAEGGGPAWIMRQEDLPETLPDSWATRPLGDGRVEVRLVGPTTLLIPDYQRYGVRAAAFVPTGFRPETRYPARKHPRGLQLAIYAASDALRRDPVRLPSRGRDVASTEDRDVRALGSDPARTTDASPGKRRYPTR